MRIPLAWKNLTHEPRRLLIATGGIGFAVVLMFMQTGFRNALFDSTVELHRRLNADLVITSSAAYTLAAPETFDIRRLAQARTATGVERVEPVYVETALSMWRHPRSQQAHAVRVIAFDPTFRALLLDSWDDVARRIEEVDAVLFDRKSKQDDYGHPAVGDTSELAGKRVRVAGQFDLGTDFANDGNLLMSDRNFRRYFGGPSGDVLDRPDLGLVKLREGVDPLAAQRELQRLLPSDVQVQTKDEFVRQELQFWRSSTPIGFVFDLGTAMGFAVGVIICYQILYADIDDHMPEFATLKAMGYRNSYFVSVVLQQSLLLSVFGFVPGAVISYALYAGLASWTGLLLNLSMERAGVVFMLTLAMCVVSGCLALRRVLGADPAELF